MLARSAVKWQLTMTENWDTRILKKKRSAKPRKRKMRRRYEQKSSTDVAPDKDMPKHIELDANYKSRLNFVSKKLSQQFDAARFLLLVDKLKIYIVKLKKREQQTLRQRWFPQL